MKQVRKYLMIVCKITEAEGKIPSITGLASTTAIPTLVI